MGRRPGLGGQDELVAVVDLYAKQEAVGPVVAQLTEFFEPFRGGVMSLVVDAHQHFWTYGTYQTSWMECRPMRAIRFSSR